MRSGLEVMVPAILIGTIGAGCAGRGFERPLASGPVRAGIPLAIGRVGVEPKTMNVQKGQAAVLRYELTCPAAVVIDLVNEEGSVVHQLKPERASAGLHRVVWNGRTGEGRRVPSGVYRYVIRAQDERGRQAVYDPSAELGGEELQPREFTFDPKLGLFRWVMPKAGYVRLRLGLEGFPHLRTLLDWVPLEAGQQAAPWDGLDESGLIRFKQHPRLSVKLTAFGLAPNTIIVQGDPSASSSAPSPGGEFPYPPLLKGSALEGARIPPTAAYLHARHPRAACREVRLKIEFPEASRHDAQGRPVLAGVVPIRVRLDERDAPSVVNQRFEVALFEDLVFLFEEEDGNNPFTHLWDTTRLPPGEHLFTVNVLSYADHYGVKTERVLIGESP